MADDKQLLSKEQSIITYALYKESKITSSLICRVSTQEGSKYFLKAVPKLREFGILAWNYDNKIMVEDLKKIIKVFPKNSLLVSLM